MTNYIPNYDKKRRILARKEQQLRRLIQRGAAVEKLVAAAEHVRQARIRWLESQVANPPLEFCRHPGKYSQAVDKIQQLAGTPAEAILAEFGVCLPGDDSARPPTGAAADQDASQ